MPSVASTGDLELSETRIYNIIGKHSLGNPRASSYRDNTLPVSWIEMCLPPSLLFEDSKTPPMHKHRSTGEITDERIKSNGVGIGLSRKHSFVFIQETRGIYRFNLPSFRKLGGKKPSSRLAFCHNGNTSVAIRPFFFLPPLLSPVSPSAKS